MSCKVYIAGPITGNNNYKKQFKLCEEKLKALGLEVANPAEAPEGLTYKEYIIEGLKLISTCQMICMLPHWTNSKGATIEEYFAEITGIPIIHAYRTPDGKGYNINNKE